MTNERLNLVAKAQRAWRAAPDTRALKRELRNGNPYALALLERHGATYANGCITRRAEGSLAPRVRFWQHGLASATAAYEAERAKMRIGGPGASLRALERYSRAIDRAERELKKAQDR